MATPGLTLGPQDPDSSSELTGKLGVHNRAKKLLDRHRANWPVDLTLALSRPRDDLRSEALLENMDEVEAALGRMSGRRAFFNAEEDVLEDAAVRGLTERERVVSIVFRRPSGRVGQGVIPYVGFEETEGVFAHLKARQDGVLLAAPAAPAATSEEGDEALRAQLAESEAKAKQATKEKADAEAALANLNERLERLENPEPWEGYDVTKVDDRVKRIHEGGVEEFGRAGLERIETYESGRAQPSKKVLQAIDDALSGETSDPAG